MVCSSDLELKADRRKFTRKKRRVYEGFKDLEKAYDKVNREALWQVLRMYDAVINF